MPRSSSILARCSGNCDAAAKPGLYLVFVGDLGPQQLPLQPVYLRGPVEVHAAVRDGFGCGQGHVHVRD